MATETVKVRYKQTEIGDIPEDWEVRTFKDICWVNQGLQIAISRRLKNPTSKSKIYITIQFLNDGKEIEYIDDYSASVCCEKEDILMTRTGNTGIVVSGVEGVFHNNFFKIHYDKQHIDREYLIYYLNQKSIQKIILTKAGTSTIPDLNHNDFYSIQFISPKTKEEQSAIAQVLLDTDTLIEQLDKLIEKKKNIKQGAMQELLTGKRRLPGFKGEWDVKEIGEVAAVYDGTHQTPEYVNSGIPFFSVENVTRNDFKNTKFISEKEHRFLTKSFKIENGDILMTRIGSIGDCKLIDWEANASFYVSLALLKIKNGFSSRYICQYSKTNAFKKEADIRSLQWAIPKKINLGDISKIRIVIPRDLGEQSAISQVLSDMDLEIEELEQKRDKYLKIKAGMMQQLLTGRIRLKC